MEYRKLFHRPNRFAKKIVTLSSYETLNDVRVLYTYSTFLNLLSELHICFGACSEFTRPQFTQQIVQTRELVVVRSKISAATH